MHLLTAGDSWTFGSEIKDPTYQIQLVIGTVRIMLIHSEYGPTKLAKLLDADDFTNISTAASNDRIVFNIKLDYTTLYCRY